MILPNRGSLVPSRTPSSSWAVGLASVLAPAVRFMNVQVGDPASVNRGCGDTGIAPLTPTGACYLVAPDTAEYGTEDVLDQDLASSISVTGAPALGTDPAGRQIYEIGPGSTATVWLESRPWSGSTATVWLESRPWSFLMPFSPTDYTALGLLQSVTGYTGRDWLKCVHTALSGYGEGPYCTDQVLMREFTQLTRVSVHPTSSVTLTARPSGSDEASWLPATGTHVAAFEYTDFAWDTQASGY